MSTAVGVKERPILFKGEMVRAILAGRKTQTRRVMKPQPLIVSGGKPYISLSELISCPYGKPGDRLWVRETFCPFQTTVYSSQGKTVGALQAIYAADGGTLLNGYKWKPSIFMPRWASRITLEITDVRVQRLQDISEEDAIAEGANPWEFGTEQTMTSGERGAESPYRGGFACLWDDINEDRGLTWHLNPWIWAITFKEVSQ